MRHRPIYSHRAHNQSPGARATMATEDERYRQSTQFRLWSFSREGLVDMRKKTNELARANIAKRLASGAAGGAGSPNPPDFLTADEEVQLLNHFTVELLRAAAFLELPTHVRATAAVFLRRFYLTNSIMTYPAMEILKTCLFFGTKAESHYTRLNK